MVSPQRRRLPYTARAPLEGAGDYTAKEGEPDGKMDTARSGHFLASDVDSARNPEVARSRPPDRYCEAKHGEAAPEAAEKQPTSGRRSERLRQSAASLAKKCFFFERNRTRSNHSTLLPHAQQSGGATAPGPEGAPEVPFFGRCNAIMNPFGVLPVVLAVGAAVLLYTGFAYLHIRLLLYPRAAQRQGLAPLLRLQNIHTHRTPSAITSAHFVVGLFHFFVTNMAIAYVRAVRTHPGRATQLSPEQLGVRRDILFLKF